MSDLNTYQEFLEACRDPLIAGNPVFAMQQLVHRMPNMSPVEQEMAFRVLQEGISAKAIDWTVAQRAAVRAQIEGFRPPRGWSRERLHALAALERFPAPIEPGPNVGRAYLLATRTHPLLGEFGVTHPLEVCVYPGLDRIRLEPKYATDHDAQYAGFLQGVLAARQYLTRHGGPVRVSSYSAEGWLPGRSREEPITGSSLGLASAMATLSAILNLRVPDEAGFTGHVIRWHRIARVERIRLKLEAARDNGMRRVFVPAANLSEAGAVAAPRFEVVGAAGLDEVVSSVWSADQRARALDRLGDALASFAPPPTPFEMPKPDGQRIVLSWVGKADPTGSYRARHRTPTPMTGTEEGPILTVCRKLQPAMVHLFYPTRPEHNDHSDHAKRVEAMLVEILPDCTVSPHPMPAVTDPSAYHLVVPKLLEEVRGIVAQASPVRPEFFVNLSSGTPQVQATWLHLRKWGIIPRARILQVLEERFMDEGERLRGARLREVPPLEDYYVEVGAAGEHYGRA